MSDRRDFWHFDPWKRLTHVEVPQDVVVLSGSRTRGVADARATRADR